LVGERYAEVVYFLLENTGLFPIVSSILVVAEKILGRTFSFVVTAHI